MHYAVTKMLSNCKRVDCIAVAMPTFTGITIATWSAPATSQQLRRGLSSFQCSDGDTVDRLKTL